MASNKTDANDADGLAQLAEVGFYQEGRVKHFDSMLSRTLVGTRTQLMKTFGLVVPKGAGRLRLYNCCWAMTCRNSAASLTVRTVLTKLDCRIPKTANSATGLDTRTSSVWGFLARA